MQHLEAAHPFLSSRTSYVSRKHDGDKVLVFERGHGLVFIFNFHPTQSFADYRVGVPLPGPYKIVLNTDRKIYDGHDRIDENIKFFTNEGDFDGRPHSLCVYIPSRVAIVLCKIET